jgi:hypothetical protein
MKLKDIVFDVWLALGVLGMVVGLAIPLIGTLYVIWGWAK